MEIEAKFRAPSPSTLQQIAEIPNLERYVFRLDPRPEIQRNTYYDSVDGRLEQARHALRVRRVSGTSLVTLKGPADIDGSVHRRAEFEFPGDNPDPAHWPEGPAREIAERLLAGASLQVLLTIDTERSLIRIEHGDRQVAVLCLDRGSMRAGSRETAFWEVEVEMLPDSNEAELQELTSLLRARIPLVPETRSKLQRGLALLRD
jgi:inorganic triphosphatase YgiF